MKKKMFALPIVLTSALMLGACGDDEDGDVNDIEVEDPMLEQEDPNDTGIDTEDNEGIEENEDINTEGDGAADEQGDTGTPGTDPSSSTDTEGGEDGTNTDGSGS